MDRYRKIARKFTKKFGSTATVAELLIDNIFLERQGFIIHDVLFA